MPNCQNQQRIKLYGKTLRSSETVSSQERLVLLVPNTGEATLSRFSSHQHSWQA